MNCKLSLENRRANNTQSHLFLPFLWCYSLSADYWARRMHFIAPPWATGSPRVIGQWRAQRRRKNHIGTNTKVIIIIPCLITACLCDSPMARPFIRMWICTTSLGIFTGNLAAILEVVVLSSMALAIHSSWMKALRHCHQSWQ